MPRVDVVVAVRNEEQNIPRFLDQISNLAIPPEIVLKVLFVEDSSTDGTRPLLRRLAQESPAVGYCTLVRGFGQGLAVAYGLSRSQADAMIMMDVDGSHPVEVIPRMLTAYLGGAIVVQCVRRTLTNRAAYRRLGTAVFQAFAYMLTGVDTRQQNIYYRLVTAEVARDLLQPRYWNYLRFPLPPPGALQMISVDTQERTLGESKYDFRRLVNLAIDAVVSLMTRARLSAMVAAATMLAGLSFWLANRRVLPVVLVLASVWLIRRWLGLHRPDTMRRMEILEEGNVP